MTTQTRLSRPRVAVVADEDQADGKGLSHFARCQHCPWQYGPTPSKSDAEWHAKRHRAAHRAGQA